MPESTVALPLSISPVLTLVDLIRRLQGERIMGWALEPPRAGAAPVTVDGMACSKSHALASLTWSSPRRQR